MSLATPIHSPSIRPMQVVRTIPELQKALAPKRQQGLSIGLVPTMGCLHSGHQALITRAKKESAVVVVSIFVNPTQFGPQEDFARYPRTFAADEQACRESGADIVFAPSTEDFYARDASTWVNVGQVSEGLCGKFRPGHFQGVATVVTMLFNAVQPQIAVFGQKDLQQLAVIRRLVRDLHFPIKIIAHETVREPNGVAMSSRNRYLSETEKTKAEAIPKALKLAQSLVEKGESDAHRILTAVRENLSSLPDFQIQYIEIVNCETMAPCPTIKRGECAIAVAGYLGKTRLIDNLILR